MLQGYMGGHAVGSMVSRLRLCLIIVHCAHAIVEYPPSPHRPTVLMLSGYVGGDALAPAGTRQTVPQRRRGVCQASRAYHRRRYHLPCRLGGWGYYPLPGYPAWRGEEEGRLAGFNVRGLQALRGQPLRRHFSKVPSTLRIGSR